jgi:uroporphyrinogen decarboxylase
MQETGAVVIGLDWRIPLDTGWHSLGLKGALQGNLDPVLLFADWKELKSRAENILRQAAGRPGHIFNLGHGILPETPVDNVKALCDFIREHSAEFKKDRRCGSYQGIALARPQPLRYECAFRRWGE